MLVSKNVNIRFSVAIGILIFAGLLSTAQANCPSGNVVILEGGGYYCTYSFQTTDNTMQITVDGVPQNSPYNVSWDWGTTHNVSVSSNQSIISGQSQYVFTSWVFTPWIGNSTSINSRSISIVSEFETSGIYSANYNTQYYLTVNTNPSSIASISGSGWYDSGATATLTAPATAGSYTFSIWNVDGNPVSGSPISVLMNAAHTTTAVYLPNSYTISVSTSPSDLTPQPTGGGTYYYGDIATVTAQPVTGYTFQRWSKNRYPDSNNISYQSNVTDNLSLVAEYSQTPYTVSVSTSDLIAQPSGGGTYHYGDTAIVTAQSVPGYTFQRWTENGSLVSSNASYEFKVTGNRSLFAEYISAPYTISVSISPSYLTPKPYGGGTYRSGDTVTVVAQSVPGYTFRRWTENGNSVSTDTAYSFNGSGNRNLIAEYSKTATPTITLESGSGTSGSEIAVKGTDFDIFAENFPNVSIYFDGTAVKEGVMMYNDESGTLGSFRTTFTVPPNTESGTYRITAQGPKNSASADFVVEHPYPWREILVISSVIGGILGLKYLYPRIISPSKPMSNIGKQLPIIMETRGGIEGEDTGSQMQDNSISVEERGGIERL